MKLSHILGAILLASATLLPAHPASAMGWELGLKGIGVQQIQITDCNTGQMTTYTSVSSHGAVECNVNFSVDFSGQGNADAHLQFGVPYVFKLVGWNKLIKVVGGIPEGGNSHDAVYLFTNNSSPPTLDTSCFPNSPHSLSGWPNAVCPPPPPPPLTLTLVVESQVQQGDKTIFTLKATAAGGTGSYTFSWTNATMSTGANVNPSKAGRTLLRGQSATVTATVTSGASSVNKSIFIEGLGP